MFDGHVECVEHEFGAQVPGHRPAHDPAAEHVEDDGQVQESRQGRHVGDVSHPQPVRGVGVELTLHQVRRRAGLGVAACGARPLAPAHAGQARLAHHPSHPLAAHRQALLGQLGLNPRRTVAPPAMRVNRPHADSEGFVAALSHRTLSLTPRIEPARAWGGSGHSGHRGDAQLGLMRSHEPVDLPGPTSRANQAAAFASICLPSADKKTAIPVLHADDGSHDAAGASPRALRCSAHLHAGLRHARPARPSCGSPGRWVQTVYLRQTTPLPRRPSLSPPWTRTRTPPRMTRPPFSRALLIISAIEFAHDRSVNGSLPRWTLRRPFLPEHPTQGHAA